MSQMSGVETLILEGAFEAVIVLMKRLTERSVSEKWRERRVERSSRQPSWGLAAILLLRE
jgi:hypothetical protein